MAKWDVEMKRREVNLTVAEFSIVNPGPNGNAVIHITDEEGGRHAVPQAHFPPLALRRLKRGSVITLIVEECSIELSSVRSPEPIAEDLGQMDLFLRY